MLTDQELITIAHYAIATSIMEADRLIDDLKRDDPCCQILRRRAFYNHLKDNPAFKKEYELARKEFIAEQKEALALTNLYLHKELLEDFVKQHKKKTLSNKEKIEVLKITGRFEVDQSNKAMEKVSKKLNEIKKVSKEINKSNNAKIIQGSKS